jgi:exonuclease VII small subunit
MFKKYESKGELLNPQISHVMGAVFGKLHDIQHGLAADVQELAGNIELNVLKPLLDYQRDVALVKDHRKELKEAYDKIEVSRGGLDRAKRDVESSQRSGGQSSRLTMMSSSNDAARRVADLARLEEKVQRLEKDLDEANLNANEKYDKYSEGLYKRIAEECDLTTFYLEYLKLQRKYHKNALKRLDTLIPGIRESLATYQKKPVFGCSLNEYVALTNNAASSAAPGNKTELSNVSPVIRRLIEGMCRQQVFSEEGIFRVAGSRIKMNCLLYAINAGYLDHLDLAVDFDVHCLAGVLKQYIRELPDSLLCDEFYDHWIAAIK